MREPVIAIHRNRRKAFASTEGKTSKREVLYWKSTGEIRANRAKLDEEGEALKSNAQLQTLPQQKPKSLPTFRREPISTIKCSILKKSSFAVAKAEYFSVID